MTGKELKEQYPFLIPRNRFTDKICDGIEMTQEEYENWSELDDMPDGWRKAFGEQMCEEIYQALLKNGGEEAVNKYRIIQIKEKWGYLHWYDSNGNAEINGIIRKYEDISDILGTSVGALKATYHHAVKKIENYIKSKSVD